MKIKHPVIIIGAPRSGTTLLFSILSSHPDLWSIYSESSFIERYIGPHKIGWSNGNRVGSEVATAVLNEKIINDFFRRALNYQALFPNICSRIYSNRSIERIVNKIFRTTIFAIFRPETIRLVEKTPRNSLRIPFLDSIFPDAHFVFLTRDPRANISSLLDGWREPKRFETYELPGGLNIIDYQGTKWNFLLPPNWKLCSTEKALVEVCAFQYRKANQIALEDLKRIPDNRKSFVKYESLIENPEVAIQHLCGELGLTYYGGTKKMAEQMPLVNATSEPSYDKWRKNEQEITKILDSICDISNQIGYSLQ